MPTNIIYDGSFEGILTVIFDCYERKLEPFCISPRSNNQSSLFSDRIEIDADPEKSNRVLNGLFKKISKNGIDKLYKVFCSELPERELLILEYCKKIFTSKYNIANDFRSQPVLRVQQIVKMINREIHRMHAFVRFQKTKDDIYAATIKPDFDVLALSVDHFKKRYQDQLWLIYDIKRDYGIYYDKAELKTVQLNNPVWTERHQIKEEVLAENEKRLQIMWKKYFDSTCIEERKNMKLHLRHVPHRYWRYLPEKTIL